MKRRLSRITFSSFMQKPTEKLLKECSLVPNENCLVMTSGEMFFCGTDRSSDEELSTLGTLIHWLWSLSCMQTVQNFGTLTVPNQVLFVLPLLFCLFWVVVCLLVCLFVLVLGCLFACLFWAVLFWAVFLFVLGCCLFVCLFWVVVCLLVRFLFCLKPRLH